MPHSPLADRDRCDCVGILCSVCVVQAAAVFNRLVPSLMEPEQEEADSSGAAATSPFASPLTCRFRETVTRETRG